MEHVGPKNHRAYMELAASRLVTRGVVFIHTIAGQRPRATIDPWFGKYIFPNAAIPTLGQLATAMEDILVAEDIQNLPDDGTSVLIRNPIAVCSSHSARKELWICEPYAFWDSAWC